MPIDKLVSFKSDSNASGGVKYSSIKMTHDGKNLRIRFVQVLDCGKRHFDFVAKERNGKYRGHVEGQKSDCSGNKFKSKSNALKLVRG